MRDIQLTELLEAGCHFGHQVRRWNPSMKKYIYGERDGIHIFDLAMTKQGLVDAGEFLRGIVQSGGKVLFVGTKRQASGMVKQAAMETGMPYMTKRWIGGMLTNFEQLNKRVRKMKQMIDDRAAGEFKKYTKREQLLLDREIAKLQESFGGVDQMDKLPEALFVVDTHKEEVAVTEAVKMGIPVVGMVDTNGRADMLTIAIPVNDDAEKSIELVVGYIKECINSKSETLNPKQEQSTNDQKTEEKLEEKKETKVKKTVKGKKNASKN